MLLNQDSLNQDFSNQDLILFHETIENLLNKKISLKINDNKTVFLSAKYLPFNKLKLSLHKCFLSAPDEILNHLKKYLVGSRKRDSLKYIKNYVEHYFKENRNKYSVEKKALWAEGDVYNLQNIFDELNKIYFEGKLENLCITWIKKPRYVKRRSITFGSYDNIYRKIKINKILDGVKIPYYFISFIIFHEILHDLYQIEVLESGRRCVHTKKFKKHEKIFIYYNKARKFEKTFMKEGVNYGWA